MCFDFTTWPDPRTDLSVFNYPGLDYRGTTYYVPENVKKYLDYKMRREPYLPMANPIVLGYLFYDLQKYWLPTMAENSNNLSHNDTEMKILKKLGKNPLDEERWYRSYQQLTGDMLFSLCAFRRVRVKLIRQSLVIQQLINDKEINYAPSATASSFYIRSRH